MTFLAGEGGGGSGAAAAVAGARSRVVFSSGDTCDGFGSHRVQVYSCRAVLVRVDQILYFSLSRI